MSFALEKTALKTVCDVMNKLYPLKYADNSWDNTGLLLDLGKPIGKPTAKILLTIDLTEAVAEEAILKKCNIIIAYHPFLFRKFNKIIPEENTQQRSLIKLIENSISVYSPHTAVDAANGGVNDWLVKCVSNGSDIIKTNVIIPDKENNNVGMGRVVEFEKPIRIEEAIERIKKSLSLEYVQLCLSKQNSQKLVKNVALCAGSGSSVFSKANGIDLYVTGEMSHHDMLSVAGNGSHLIVCGHCNTERGFLQEMAARLRQQPVLAGASIVLSETDCSPFTTV